MKQREAELWDSMKEKVDRITLACSSLLNQTKYELEILAELK